MGEGDDTRRGGPTTTCSVGRAATGAGAWTAGGGGTATGCGSSAGSVWVVRAGNSVSGSTYPCGSAVSRTPRCTYGVGCSASPLGPTVPTTSPWATAVPTRTAIEPRCTSVIENPSGVRIVSVCPAVGTAPANPTTPAFGARTSEAAGAPMSMPRCWPPVYGSSSNAKPRSTGPSTGQLHALATGAPPSATTSATTMTNAALLPDLETIPRGWYPGGRLLSNMATASRGTDGSAQHR
jgi:hypothetical protein